LQSITKANINSTRQVMLGESRSSASKLQQKPSGVNYLSNNY